jgi:hypothetical protein
MIDANYISGIAQVPYNPEGGCIQQPTVSVAPPWVGGSARHRTPKGFDKTGDTAGEESIRAAAEVIRSGIRRLSSLADDAREELASRSPERWEELKRKASEEGASLLRLSYFDLSKLGIDSKALKEIAGKIHQLELLEQYENGRHIIDECLRSIDELAEELRGVFPNG